ncbi:MAG: class I SAM-dependent methyltransferase [Gammaproteobacteria bacterium]|nr:class I SAM-dependent methyltransferase [Gammaproteobacteria bacterium]
MAEVLKEIKFQCAICNTEQNTRSIARLIDGYNVVRCASCDGSYLYKIPTAEELEEYYSKYYLTRTSEDPSKAVLVKLHTPIIDYLLSNLDDKINVNILDYGFGAGYFLKAVAEKNFNAFGFDLSEQNRIQLDEYSKSNNINIKLLGNSTSDTGIRYDIITLFQVIEHLNDPVKTLTELSLLQEKNGILYIECPNNSAYMLKIKNIINKILGRKKFYNSLKIPEHIFGFNKKSISILLDRIGYDVVDIGDYYLSDGVHQVEGIWWWPPLLKNRNFYNPISFAKSIMQLVDRIFSLLFGAGSGLFVLAKKR